MRRIRNLVTAVLICFVVMSVCSVPGYCDEITENTTVSENIASDSGEGTDGPERTNGTGDSGTSGDAENSGKTENPAQLFSLPDPPIDSH